MPYKLHEFKARLKRKGFIYAKSTGGHEVYVFLNERNEQTTVKLHVPNPHKGRKGEVGDKLLNNMAGQLALEVTFFSGVIECPQSHADVCNLYRTRERIT